MKLEEFITLAGTANADNLPDVLTKLQDAFKEKCAEVDQSTQALAERDATIKQNTDTIAELRDTNMKLFVRQSQAVPPEPEDKPRTAEEIAKEMCEHGYKH